MIPPVVCFTCGRQITLTLINAFNEERERTAPQNELNKQSGIITYNENVSYADFFKANGVARYCCRTMLTTHVRLDAKIS
jgi:DNA-directed RNA polymerase subunit N (RpoN/RPB10)